MTTPDNILRAIPAEFFMISGSADSQTSADAFNVGKFQLPNPAGKAGGACTSALLQVLYRNHDAGYTMSWVEVLREMRSNLQSMGYDQIPQLTSSRLIDVHQPMHIIPPNKREGTKRALLIGINYTGQQGELRGCHNDVKNIKEFLLKLGFLEENMLILMDDNQHHAPTKTNIENSFKRITEYSQAGDIVFVHYSGHGGREVDYDGDEDDGYDETLIPVDFQRVGQIVDDDILKILVRPMRAGVAVTVLMDCCHSGTVLDLPYRFGADDSKMRMDQGFNLAQFQGVAEAAICCMLMASLLN